MKGEKDDITKTTHEDNISKIILIYIFVSLSYYVSTVNESFTNQTFFVSTTFGTAITKRNYLIKSPLHRKCYTLNNVDFLNWHLSSDFNFIMCINCFEI